MSFDAPWGLSLKLITTFSVIILVGIPLIGLFNHPNNEFIWFLSMVVFPFSILIVSAFFMIRGYELSKDKLIILRLGWNTEVNLKGLQAVEINPDAMKKSLRTFGNGGLFSITGRFRNKQLGSYRAFVTDPKLSVILRFEDKIIVVTPDNPNRFANLINGTRPQ